MLKTTKRAWRATLLSLFTANFGSVISGISKSKEIKGSQDKTSLEYWEKYLKRENKKYCVVLVKIDDVDKIRSNYGKHECDKTIKKVRDSLRAMTRKHDIVSNYHNEGFIIILESVDQAQAICILNRISSKLTKDENFGYNHHVFNEARAQRDIRWPAEFRDGVDKALCDPADRVDIENAERDCDA